MNRYDLARAVARDAGKLAHRAFGVSATKMKGRHDVVTEMDREVERFRDSVDLMQKPGPPTHRVQDRTAVPVHSRRSDDHSFSNTADTDPSIEAIISPWKGPVRSRNASSFSVAVAGEP